MRSVSPTRGYLLSVLEGLARGHSPGIPGRAVLQNISPEEPAVMALADPHPRGDCDEYDRSTELKSIKASGQDESS